METIYDILEKFVNIPSKIKGSEVEKLSNFRFRIKNVEVEPLIPLFEMTGYLEEDVLHQDETDENKWFGLIKYFPNTIHIEKEGDSFLIKVR